jgi:ribosomal protein S18 acetylase RimI-like enzyme
MEIRSLTISDYDQIVALWQKAGLSYKPEGRDRKDTIRSQMAVNPDFFLGAFEGVRLLGVLVVSTDGRRGWINRLAVDPNCRRKGVAKALISEAERILREHGMRIFCALIEDTNSGSMQLFKDCGYRAHRDIVYFSKRDSDRV